VPSSKIASIGFAHKELNAARLSEVIRVSSPDDDATTDCKIIIDSGMFSTEITFELGLSNFPNWQVSFMRNRGSVVIVENGKVVLIQRIRDGSVYYVFPGGGIENGETPEAAAKREALEELGVEVKINECLSKVEYNGTQYFFLAEIISGALGNGQGEEYTDKNRGRGTYLPMWVEIESLSSIDVRPREVALKVQSLLKK